ncbi:MAG: hypothetical protein ABSG62_11640 [Terracidiphilus sp.]|jgi:hypothetical protein
MTALERMYTTADGLEAILKTVLEGRSNPAGPSFYLASGILTYAGKKSAFLRDSLQETIEVLKKHSVLAHEVAERSHVCFDDIFIEVAALCFGFLLGVHIRGQSKPADEKYFNTLKDALTSADGLLTYLSTTQKPVLYLTRRVHSYVDPKSPTTVFESFNTRILSSVFPGRDLTLELSAAFLTPHMLITFTNLNPDQLEAFSRGLYVQSIDG